MNRQILADFQAGAFISTPLVLEDMEARLFLLDPPALSADQISVAEIAAVRAASLFEHALLTRRLIDDAEMNERMRVARNLHDGVLQALAGANLQLQELKELTRRAPELVPRRLQAVQEMLAQEQRDLRNLIGTLEIGDDVAEETALGPHFASLTLRLSAQWLVQLDHAIEPPDLQLPTHLADELTSFVTEAVANAVKHGACRHVDLVVRTTDGTVELVVRDDGRGFGFNRSLADEELRVRRIGPRSLRERAARCGGRLFIDAADVGAAIRVRLPLWRHL